MSRITAADLDRIAQHAPECLRQRHQWVCWKYVLRDGKQIKFPVNPRNGQPADSTDPRTWTSFDEALAAARIFPGAGVSGVSGVGFVFSVDDPFCGVDLDDSMETNTQRLKPWAQQIISELASYTEISPSGCGVKIFLQGTKPGVRCRKGYHDGEVEMYDRDRFFTVTGRVLEGTPVEVGARQQELNAVYHRVFGRDVSAPSSQLAPAIIQSPPADMDDHEIIRLASGGRKSGAKFSALWAGRWNEYFNSRSEADSSVVFTLAFFTKDAVQIDRLFRGSGLMRDKWDETHGQQTYGQITIAKALATVTKQYKPNRKKTPATGAPGSQKKSVASPSGADVAGNPLSGEPTPGSIDPETGRLILSTDRTLPTAQAFVQEFYTHSGGEGHTLYHYAGMPMAWRDNRYVELEDESMRHRLLPWLHAAVRMRFDSDANQWVPQDFPANPNTVKAALDSIKAYTHLPATTISPSWIGIHPDRPDAREIIACRSSLLHLPTMTHLPPTPAFFAINALDYDPDPSAKPPESWLEFLGQIFGDDTQAWDLLQDWMGYCLTGDTSQHKMLLLVGPKRSGKGTIARVLTRLVGQGNVCGPTTSSLAGAFGLQPLIGKSLAIVSDARFSGENIQTVIERLLCISGEDTLTIDRKHMTSVTMKLPTRFVFLTNELPRLTDSSGALAGRFMMLRLTESFYGREDKTLTQRLLDELPGILNWAIEGWKRLNQRGHFVQPTSADDAMRDMEDLSSPVGAFVREQCIVGAGQRIWVDDLYAAWKSWCDQEGRSSVTTKQTFGRDLLAAVPGISCRRNLNLGRFYEGISLHDTGE